MQLKVNSRMMAGFVVMAIFLVVINMVSIFYANYIYELVEKTILAGDVTGLAEAKGLERSLMEQKGFTVNFLLTSNEQWLQRFDEAKMTFYDRWHRARDTAYSSEEKQVLEQIRRSYEEFLDLQRQVVALHKPGHASEAYALRLRRTLPALEATVAECDKFWNIHERQLNEVKTKFARIHTIATRIRYGVIIGGILLALLLGIVISRSIAKPIDELVLKVRRVTEKEGVVHNIEIAHQSELEQLGQGVRHLIDRVNQINQELARSRQSLLRSEKLAAAGQLAAGIAHEIRNPLTTVKTLAFTFAEGLPPEDGRQEGLRLINSEIERMEGILQSFLDFARPAEPEFAPIGLTQTIKNARALILPEIHKHGIRSFLDIPEDHIIYADRNQVTQTLINLFRNAIEAMPSGGDLRIAARPMNSILGGGQRMVQIEIQDSGTGIPDNLLPRLFDPFVTGKKAGTGLGLSIASQIIELHGGWIEARNNPDRGATFTVSLPIKA